MHTPSNDPKTSSDGARPAPKILIVEDEVLAAMALRDELEAAGYDVQDLTGHHETAIESARADKPDLALVNIQLHGRNDGIALARDLKEIGVPVMFISGQVSRARSARTEAIASLPKPYSAADAVRAVRYLLARLAGDDSLPKPPILEVFDMDDDPAAPDAG